MKGREGRRGSAERMRPMRRWEGVGREGGNEQNKLSSRQLIPAVIIHAALGVRLKDTPHKTHIQLGKKVTEERNSE